MLNYLELKNFIFVKSLKLSFSSGLQILTGETGAGKSIIVGAIHLIMGGQLKGNVFRDPKQKVSLSAIFSINSQNQALMNLINQYDIDISDNELFFSREIQTDGKSSVFINGRKVTNTIIREFRDSLFDFHSQRDQQLLLNEDFQLLCLDHFARLDSERDEYTQCFHAYQSQVSHLKKLESEERKSEDKIRLYEFQINEIEDLKLKADEEQELDAEYQVLSNAQEILDACDQLNHHLYEKENAVYDQISSFCNLFERFARMNNLISEQNEHLQAILSHFDDLVQISRQIPQEIYLDQNRLDEVESRIQLLHQIKTKYRKSISEIIAYKTEMQKYLKEHNSLKDKIEEAKNSLDQLRQDLLVKADSLSLKRNQSAINFASEIEENLQDLAIPSANVKIKVDKNQDICNNQANRVIGLKETGQDQVEFLFNANKGGQLQILKHSASGGELSRLLLVIKKILANNLPPQTIIFDEIDSGIGGKTADMLGQYIYNISDYHQVICITHLVQVASYAEKHFKIEKNTLEEMTEIQVDLLNENERHKEIARMLSGDLSEYALNHAKELLKKRR
ncbi:MAG TPA: DNA repair protein RecN [Candidatus Cloacimonadota bacterium]|mgnify:FL=1|nr:DNA repair protein RecN [Candidatus Cloacimonadota bacterium]